MKITIIYVIFATFLIWNVEAEKCPSNCGTVTFRGLINNLWKLCTPMTPLLNDYRNNLISLTNFGLTYQSIVFGQTILAVEKFTNIQPNVSISCLYTDIIKLSMVNDRKLDLDLYNRIWKDFQKFGINSCDDSVIVGLAAAGCIPTQRRIDTSLECNVDESILAYIKEVDGIPNRLRSLIKVLLVSDNPRERDVGLAATASMTPRLMKFFSNLLRNSQKEVIDALKMKGCVVQIPLKCCRERANQLQNGMNFMKMSFLKNINETTNIDQMLY